jgi:hypothetical protein
MRSSRRRDVSRSWTCCGRETEGTWVHRRCQLPLLGLFRMSRRYRFSLAASLPYYNHCSRGLGRIDGAAGGIWTRDQRLERPLCLSGLHHRSAVTKGTKSVFKGFATGASSSVTEDIPSGPYETNSSVATGPGPEVVPVRDPTCQGLGHIVKASCAELPALRPPEDHGTFRERADWASAD